MKIYLSHSKNQDFLNELYNPIINSKLTEKNEFIFPHDKVWEDVDTKEIIRQSDVLLVEVSYPAFGVGIEIGRAEAAKLRIIAIKKTSKKLNSSVSKITNEIVSYTDEKDLIKQLEKILL